MVMTMRYAGSKPGPFFYGKPDPVFIPGTDHEMGHRCFTKKTDPVVPKKNFNRDRPVDSIASPARPPSGSPAGKLRKNAVGVSTGNQGIFCWCEKGGRARDIMDFLPGFCIHAKKKAGIRVWFLASLPLAKRGAMRRSVATLADAKQGCCRHTIFLVSFSPTRPSETSRPLPDPPQRNREVPGSRYFDQNRSLVFVINPGSVFCFPIAIAFAIENCPKIAGTLL